MFGKWLAVAQGVKELSLWGQSKLRESCGQGRLPVRVVATVASVFLPQCPGGNRVVRAQALTLPPPGTATTTSPVLAMPTNRSGHGKEGQQGMLPSMSLGRFFWKEKTFVRLKDMDRKQYLAEQDAHGHHQDACQRNLWLVPGRVQS